MSIGTMLATAFDRDMYDHPGRVTTMAYAVRKWRDRPRLDAGQSVTIVRMTFVDNGYGGQSPRVLVRNEAAEERWVDGSNLVPITADARHPALERISELAAEKFADLD